VAMQKSSNIRSHSRVVDTLSPSARTCFSCFGEAKHFEDCYDFQIASCFLYSLHPDHVSDGASLLSNRTEKDKENSITRVLIYLTDSKTEQYYSGYGGIPQ
jgi:hypothetical protein